jgi:hypothetical protein
MCYNIKSDIIVNVRKLAFVTLYWCINVLIYKLFGSLLTVYRLHPFCVYVTGETSVAGVHKLRMHMRVPRFIWRWFCLPKKGNE